MLKAIAFQNTAQMPLYLYAFLNTSSKSKPFEYLRLTSLGVIGALVKVCLVIKTVFIPIRQEPSFLTT